MSMYEGHKMLLRARKNETNVLRNSGFLVQLRIWGDYEQMFTISHNAALKNAKVMRAGKRWLCRRHSPPVSWWNGVARVEREQLGRPHRPPMVWKTRGQRTKNSARAVRPIPSFKEKLLFGWEELCCHATRMSKKPICVVMISFLRSVNHLTRHLHNKPGWMSLGISRSRTAIPSFLPHLLRSGPTK